MIQINLLPQKKYIMQPNKIYFKILNQAGCECFDNATSISLFMVLLNDILMFGNLQFSLQISINAMQIGCSGLDAQNCPPYKKLNGHTCLLWFVAACLQLSFSCVACM